MIEVENLAMRQGAFHFADITFAVPTGAYAVLMGKTGCGKTTVLEAVCGLRQPTAGAIRLMGRDVTRLRPAERHVGYLPQDVALFPTMTVGRQIGLALEIRRAPHPAIRQRIRELAELLGITHLLGRRPLGLSGGEAQRVALGRALSARPPVLCLDEPLSALDEATKAEMLELLRTVRHETGVTVLHVTHNRREAEALADLLFEFQDGRLRRAEPAGGQRAGMGPVGFEPTTKGL